MTKYASRQELADKIDYEGGLESFLHYGLNLLDLPESDPNLFLTADAMLKHWNAFQRFRDAFMRMLPEPGDE